MKHQYTQTEIEQCRRRSSIVRSVVLTLLAMLLLAGGIVLFSIWNSAQQYEISFYQLTSDNVSENLRLVFLSDLHLKEYGEENETLLADVSALSPDLILLGGDLVTYSEDSYDNMLSLCEKLVGIAPVYGIMGNHEDEKTYLAGDKELYDRFTATGAVFLRNETETLEIGGNTVQLVGLSGNSKGYAEYGGKSCMENLDAGFNGCRIVMAHIPALYLDELLPYDYDLGLAGHTHGGIVRLPRIGGLYSAEEGLFPTYSGGQYRLGNGADLIVSRGLGNSGRIPRVFNPAELAVIDVNWY